MKVVVTGFEPFGGSKVNCVGEAGGRDGVTPKKIAINYDNARIPDNNGKSPRGVSIFHDGPDGYFTGLPINNIVRNILANDVTSSVSYTAGTYVCTHIFYGLMHLIKTKFPRIKGGFIHVPVKGMMELDQISKALRVAIETTINAPGDKIIICGTED
jgi:pyroglutamyl-peptidase